MSTRSKTDEGSFFVRSKAERDKFCVGKDKVIHGILDSWFKAYPVAKPDKFTAVLMPALFGPEIDILQDRKRVPGKNLFAIERNPSTHERILNPPAGILRHRYKTVQTTSAPMDAVNALDDAYYRIETPCKLVYLDYFGQPDDNHWKALHKLFRLGFLSRGSLLITTLGENRGDPFSCQLNARVRKTVPVAQAYIESALKASGSRLKIRKICNHKYQTIIKLKPKSLADMRRSRASNFITTEVWF